MNITASLNGLYKKLAKVECELEKVRGCSPLTHGWQTQRYAKAARKWDKLAQERIELIEKIEILKMTETIKNKIDSFISSNGDGCELMVEAMKEIEMLSVGFNNGAQIPAYGNEKNQLSCFFDKLRNDKNHHLGMGDIRLTMAQQEEIIKMFEAQKIAKEHFRKQRDKGLLE